MPNTTTTVSAEMEIVTASEISAADLRLHAENINSAIDLVVKHEEAFSAATLEPCLLIGREIAKARAIFGLSNIDRAALGGEAKAALSAPLTKQDCEVEIAPNPLGFGAWLAREIPRLKRPTAIRYATCYAALELPADAPDTAVRAAVKQLTYAADKGGQPRPSLNSLYKAGKPSKEQLALPEGGIAMPCDSPEIQRQDAREYFHDWITQGENLVSRGHLDALDKPGLAKLRDFNLWLRDRINAR